MNEKTTTVRFSGIIRKKMDLRVQALGTTKAAVVREALAQYFGVATGGKHER